MDKAKSAPTASTSTLGRRDMDKGLDLQLVGRAFRPLGERQEFKREDIIGMAYLVA